MEKTGDPWLDVGRQVKISTPDLRCQATWSPWSLVGPGGPSIPQNYQECTYIYGEGNGNTFQYSCLENLMDRGAWRDTVHGVAKSWTQLNN